MDVAYDHIQEETLTPEETAAREQRKQSNNLNTEFQEAFKAVSSSPWGAKLGGFFGQVKKQVNTFLTLQQCPEVANKPLRVNPSTQKRRKSTTRPRPPPRRASTICFPAPATSRSHNLSPLPLPHPSPTPPSPSQSRRMLKMAHPQQPPAPPLRPPFQRTSKDPSPCPRI